MLGDTSPNSNTIRDGTPATLVHLSMLSVYVAYTGLVLYFILALSHPYIGPAAIDTSPYSVVLEQDLGTRPPIATQ
jgi:hypothetical protein